MRKSGKSSRCILVILAFFAITGFHLPSGKEAACNCPSLNVSRTVLSASSVSFSWVAPEEATGYKIWYIRREDGFASQDFTTAQPSVQFFDLPPGTYVFFFVTQCGEERSETLITEDLLMG